MLAPGGAVAVFTFLHWDHDTSLVLSELALIFFFFFKQPCNGCKCTATLL